MKMSSVKYYYFFFFFFITIDVEGHNNNKDILFVLSQNKTFRRRTRHKRLVAFERRHENIYQHGLG